MRKVCSYSDRGNTPGIWVLTFGAGEYIIKCSQQEAGSVCRSTRAELIYLGNVMYAFEGIRILLKKIRMPFFIPASNEPSAVLARAFGECREGQIPCGSAARYLTEREQVW